MSLRDHVAQIWWSLPLLKKSYNRFPKSPDLKVMTWIVPGLLVASESTPLDLSACQIWWSVVIGLIEVEMSTLTSNLIWTSRKKLNSSPRSAILKYFQNQEYRFTIPMPWINLDEGRKQKVIAKLATHIFSFISFIWNLWDIYVICK